MTKSLSLADLAVGQKYVSSSYSVTVEEIKRFATQFDPQPFHTDETAAKHSVFGELVASGWHTASLSMRLIVDSVHLDCGLIGLGGTLAWRKPVKPGDSLHVESVITSIKPSQSKPDQAVVSLSCMTLNQHNETVIEFTPQLMVFGKAKN